MLKHVCDDMIANDVLTPNGDGINDTWIIINAERFPSATIKVYNRWGKEVFSTQGYNNDWNGSSSLAFGIVLLDEQLVVQRPTVSS